VKDEMNPLSSKMELEISASEIKLTKEKALLIIVRGCQTVGRNSPKKKESFKLCDIQKLNQKKSEINNNANDEKAIMKYKSLILASFSHELRTPLNGIYS
jgi:signal transduction histidine kinase